MLSGELTVLDSLREQEASIRRRIALASRDFPVKAALEEIPGIGLLLAARFVAIIFTHILSGKETALELLPAGVKTCESGGKKDQGRQDRPGGKRNAERPLPQGVRRRGEELAQG